MRKIIHVDMDCFSRPLRCAMIRPCATFRSPSAAARDRRGVISTATTGTQIRVHSAMPTRMALKLCPHLKVIPGRMEAYKEASHHIP